MTLAKPRPLPPKVRVRQLRGQHHKRSLRYIKAYWPYLPVFLVLAGGIFVNSFITRQHRNVLGYSTAISSTTLLAQTNGERSARHQALLQIDDKLTAAAQARADDMAKRDYWSHITPDGKQPSDFIQNAGYQYRAVGENLAYGFGTSAQVTAAWMQSPEHRANVLSELYQDVGFATANVANYRGDGPRTIVVALYGEPISAADYTNHASIQLVSQSQAVSRLELVSTSHIVAVIVAGLCGVVIGLFAARHALAWRRVIVKGEQFVLKHPLFDVLLMSAAVLTFLLSHAAGSIL